MAKELTAILTLEKESLENLMSLLKDQHRYIMDKNVFQLEAIVEKIEACNKEIAQFEMQRRKMIGNKSMSDYVNDSSYRELQEEYSSIKKIVQLVKFQKDTNELLIKQQMSFNARIINLINPNRELNTYNSYGTLRR